MGTVHDAAPTSGRVFRTLDLSTKAGRKQPAGIQAVGLAYRAPAARDKTNTATAASWSAEWSNTDSATHSQGGCVRG